VANLTLMALGSSAPEILLSVIEILSNNFYAGDLGPSTIVGSAAFNLFCISAVCVVSIPNGEIRMIKDTNVYMVTAFFSVFAYLWIFLIVSGNTPDVIDIWEGIVTFLFFPLLTGLAFAADKGYLSSVQKRELSSHDRVIDKADLSKEELASLELRLRKQHGMELSDEEVARLIGKETAEPKSKAAYRVAATRALLGGKRVKTGGSADNLQDSKKSMSSVVPEQGGLGSCPDDSPAPSCFVAFSAKNYAVMESVGNMLLPVRRTGDLSVPMQVDYKCRDGQAKAGEDFDAVEGTLKFEAGQEELKIAIKIINDTACEDDEDFFVELSNPRGIGQDASVVALGSLSTARVLIVDDDIPGILFFEQEVVEVQEESSNKKMRVTVKRKDG
ncbi:unnamed protein product, partial [Polarella glacialis]